MAPQSHSKTDEPRVAETAFDVRKADEQVRVERRTTGYGAVNSMVRLITDSDKDSEFLSIADRIDLQAQKDGERTVADFRPRAARTRRRAFRETEFAPPAANGRIATVFGECGELSDGEQSVKVTTYDDGSLHHVTAKIRLRDEYHKNTVYDEDSHTPVTGEFIIEGECNLHVNHNGDVKAETLVAAVEA